MVATLIDSEGKVTEFKDGVAHVTSQQMVAPNPEAPAQQVLGPDPLADAANVIANLKDEEVALSKMHELMLDQAMNWFQIGGTLLKIKENGWFGGYDSFGALLWSEFGFKKSKAYHLIAIYKTLLEAGLSWDEVKEFGWPKLGLICAKAVSAALDQEQFSKILEKAKTVKYVELKASLKAEFPSTAETLTKTLIFKPHPEQFKTIEVAIEKAKTEVDTKYGTVALDHLCNVYLSPGASQPKEKAGAKSAVAIPKPGEKGYEWQSMEQHFSHLLDKHGGDPDEALKEVVHAFEAIFPKVVVTVGILNEDTG